MHERWKERLIAEHKRKVSRAMGWPSPRGSGPALAPILWNIALWVVILLVIAATLRQVAPQYFKRPSGGWGGTPGSAAQPAEPAASAMPQPKPRRQVEV